jgi:hypothetical protein
MKRTREDPSTVLWFWKDIYKHASKHRELWHECEIDDVYKCRNMCNVEECWYKRNLDRLDGLEIFSFANEYFICDVCWDNGCADEVFSRDRQDDDKVFEFELDMDNLNEELKKTVESLEVRDCCELCNTFFYYATRGAEYWESCSRCLHELFDENNDIDEIHNQCGDYYSILLCDSCIMHGGGFAYSTAASC